MNHATASAKLGTRASRKLANNTYLEKREDGSIAIRLHSTDVVTFRPDGSTVLNSGGWFTSTTKDRIGLAFRVSQHKGRWTVSVNGKGYPFADGMKIGKRGGVTGAGRAPKVDKWREKVSKYADKFVDKLLTGKIPAPSGGDCWYCAVRAVDGKPFGGSEHIRQHVKEGYFVPSMLTNIADRLSPIARGDIGALMGLNAGKPSEWSLSITKKQVRSALRRYVGQHTGVSLR